MSAETPLPRAVNRALSFDEYMAQQRPPIPIWDGFILGGSAERYPLEVLAIQVYGSNHGCGARWPGVTQVEHVESCPMVVAT